MPQTASKPAPASQFPNLPIFLLLALSPFIAKALVLLMGAQGYGLQSIYKLFQLIAPCVWRFHWQHARGARILWPTDEPLPSATTWLIAIASALGLGGAGIAAATWLLPSLQIDPQSIRSGLDERFAVGVSGAVFVVLFLSLINSALEELHFRAWMDGELSKRWGSTAGMSISAVAFGAMHVLIFMGMPGVPLVAIALVPIALAGAAVCWSLIMRRRGGIHAAWLSHGLTDALLLGWGLHWLGYV
jgi:membrane protease YdiL (CAAX protease family)